MSQPVIICQKWLLRHVLHGGLVTLMCGKLVIKTNIQKWSIRWDNIRSFWLLAWRGVWGLWGGPGSCSGHPGCGQCSMSRVTSPSARGGYTSSFLSWKYEIIGNFLSCFRYFTMFSQSHLQSHWLDIQFRRLAFKSPHKGPSGVGGRKNLCAHPILQSAVCWYGRIGCAPEFFRPPTPHGP